MAQVSKRPLRKEIYDQIFGLLPRILTESYSRDEAIKLLNDLLTPTEKIVLAKRLAIALLLAKEYGYEQIKEILCVSMPTVAMVNSNLKYKGEGYRHFVNRVLREQKIKKLLEKIEDLVMGVGASGGKGSGAWRDLRRRIRDKRWKKSTPLSE